MDNNELYQKVDEEIQSAINNYPVHEWTLHDMESYVNNMAEKYGAQFISQQSVNMPDENEMLTHQQFRGGNSCRRRAGSRRRDRCWWDWDPCWDCNRGRNCDFRDYIRLGILRNVFDRRR